MMPQRGVAIYYLKFNWLALMIFGITKYRVATCDTIPNLKISLLIPIFQVFILGQLSQGRKMSHPFGVTGGSYGELGGA